MKNSKKNQGAIEFLVITAFVLFLFITLLYAVEINTQNKIKSQRDLALKEITETLSQEIILTEQSPDGYSRNFIIPEKVLNDVEYTLEIRSNSIYAITLDEKNAILIPTINILGQPIKGKNTIYKKNGEIYLNI